MVPMTTTNTAMTVRTTQSVIVMMRSEPLRVDGVNRLPRFG